MNKKKLIIITALILAASAAIILMFAFIERPAFSGIEKDEISSVSYFIYYFEDDDGNNILNSIDVEVPYSINVGIPELKDADRIIILDCGKVVAVGTHKELLENNEIYKELYYSQNKSSSNKTASKKVGDING